MEDIVVDAGWWGWRMLGPNNRELGRSPVTHHGSVLIDAIMRLQAAEQEQLQVQVGKTGDGEWIWRLFCAGQLVAVSSRSYRRQRECSYSAGQFVEEVASGVMSPGMSQELGLTDGSRQSATKELS